IIRKREEIADQINALNDLKKMAEKYPEYGFEKHKGYGTALHCEMLRKYGASEIHRYTFLKKILGKNA
ncbi:MAG: hypothetical protein K2J37_04355, partial [Ruminococcus sp.]|nr:hypothetical protein [Ruminococcus sp.]